MIFRKKQLRAVLAGLAGALLGSGYIAQAQSLSDAEIQQAVDLMRASGQSEAQVQQFLDAMQKIKAMQSTTPPDPSSQANDIQRVTGLSTADTQVVGIIAGAIKARQDQQNSGMLADEIKEFEEQHADKPDITANFDGEDIRLKIIDCYPDDTFTIYTQAAPTQHNTSGLSIGANRGWSVTENAWKADISVHVNGDHYRAEMPSGPIGADGLTFDGVVISRETGAEKQLHFRASCEGQ